MLNERSEYYAVVIGSDHYNTLGVIRSLGEKNIDCVFINIGGPGGFVSKSRYISTCINIDIKNLILTLEQISINDNRIGVIFPTGDKIMEILCNSNLQISNLIFPSLKIPVDDALDKAKMSKIASQCGLHIPEELSTNTNVFPNWHKYPAILKPQKSICGKKSDITIAYNDKDLIEMISRFKSNKYDEVLIQEYLNALNKKTIEIMGVSLHDGSVLFPNPITKIREYPSQNGSTSFAYFDKQLDADTCSSIISMIHTIGLCGLFDIEFIENEGTIYFIELNIRNGAPAYSLTKKDLNLPFIWFLSALGIPTEFNNYELSGTLMAEQLDIYHVKNGTISIKKWIIDYLKCRIHIFYQFTDFVPCISYIIMKLKRRFKKNE